MQVNKSLEDELIRHLLRNDLVTVGIVAVCEANSESPKIVFSADRQITAGIKFEHGKPKIKKITEYCYVIMSSSNTLRSDMIVEQVIDNIKEKPSIREIVELFREVLEESKRDETEREVLKKYGLTYSEFIERSNSLSDILVKTVIGELDAYQSNFECEFLVFGLEPTPHIYVVDQDGRFASHDYMGFAVIGNGKTLAFSELTRYRYHPNISYVVGLVRVYNAKRIAERITGVGETTDLFVLNIDDRVVDKPVIVPWPVDETTMDILEKSFERMQKAQDRAFVKGVYEVGNHLKEMGKKEEENDGKGEVGQN